MGELVLLCESQTMRWEMFSSVRALLCGAGEMSSSVLNLGQGGGGAAVKMYRQSRRGWLGGE